jgi:hypothetical protein
MATGVTCELWADTERVPDGSTPIDPLDPIALSGLRLTWGRSTTVDQPEASTCSFDVADLPGGQAFGELFRVGSPIRVTATGTTYPDPTVSTFRDPGFETGSPITTGRVRATVARSTRRAHAGTHAAAIAPTVDAVPGTGVSAVFAPGAFVTTGTNPDAWDDIPKTLAGQRWSYGASVFVPTGMKATLRPVLFDAPWSGSWRVVSAAAPLSVVGDNAWHVVSGPVISDPGGWIGLQLTLLPHVGLAWDGLSAALTWDAVAADWQWNDYGTAYLDDVRVLAPASGAASQVLVFAGRITDLEAVFDDAIDAPLIRATCADFTADLDNIDVGDEPWLVEALSARFSRILTLSGLPVTATIDPSIAGTLVTWRDADRQPATGLLAELAASVDSVMWSAVHAVSGPYLDVEDPANRPPASELALVGGVVVIVDASTGGLELSACDVLREPVTWRENVGDVATRVSVDWKMQVAGPATEDATYTIVDPSREGYGTGRYGTRRYGLSTQLQSEADAAAVAQRILDRTVLGWRVSGVAVDDLVTASDVTPDAATHRMLTLLDGTSRNGLLLRLTDLPSWAPGAPTVGVYLEGGSYTFDGGRWLLELGVSAAKNQGDSATWDELDPAWQWDQFDPAITWDDLNGVGS